MKDFLPAFKILRRKPLGPMLIIFQTGLIITILTLLYLSIYHQVKVLWRSSGIAEPELGILNILADDTAVTAQQRVQRDLRYLNELQDIALAAPMYRAPFDTWPRLKTLHTEPENSQGPKVTANTLYTNQSGLQTLGVSLLQGRNFSENDVQYLNTHAPGIQLPIIISINLAQQLFPEGDALGRYLYDDSDSFQVIGVTADVSVDNRSGTQQAGMTAFLPLIIYNEDMSYIVRGNKPLELAQLQEYREALQDLEPDRIISDIKTLSSQKATLMSQLRFSLKLIVMLFVVLIAICALGIIGITSYRVTTSRRNIAIRRALGATRWQVCRYFLSEDILIFLAAFAYGVVLAPTLAKILGKLMNTEILLPFYTIAISSGMVLTVVLLAAAYPVLQASRVSPTSLSGNLAAKK